MDEKRIYVVVAGTVKVPSRTVVQPPGRQIAQACHAVSKLRHGHTFEHGWPLPAFEPMTTIILQCRDDRELYHNFSSLDKKKLAPVVFYDTNEQAYGAGVQVGTAIAVFATKKQIQGILDYLPLWGAQ